MDQIFDRLEKLKKKAKMTNEEVGQMMGITPSVMRNYLSGKTAIPASTIIGFAQVLNTSVEYILTGIQSDDESLVMEPTAVYGSKKLPITADDALRASVEALITMYHRVELLTKKTGVLEREMTEIKGSK